MIRYLTAALAALGLLSFFAPPGAGGGGKEAWGTIKGRIVWGGTELRKPEKVKVTMDQAHCLEKGPLLDDLYAVNPKNKGFKNVFVALKPPEGNPLPIHPKLKDVANTKVVLDQPRCLFTPRAVAVREGQEVEAKNSSPVPHNIRWIGNPDFNESGNVTLPAGKSFLIKNLKAQPLPLLLECNIHPWMKGRLAVYDHPYFAVTDENGNFEIKLAPAGTHRLTGYHEGLGWRGGAKGKAGMEITIKAGEVTDLGDLPMGK
jgi:plastocyanin